MDAGATPVSDIFSPSTRRTPYREVVQSARGCHASKAEIVIGLVGPLPAIQYRFRSSITAYAVEPFTGGGGLAALYLFHDIRLPTFL